MEQAEITEQLELLSKQLEQRRSLLVMQDPASQRIFGQIEAYKSMIKTPATISGNGELIEEETE